MHGFKRWTKYIAAATVAGVALFLGAALLSLGVPFIVGITSDLIAHPGAPLILALGSAAAIVIWRALRQAVGYGPTEKSPV
jgi:hypothetical protein